MGEWVGRGRGGWMDRQMDRGQMRVLWRAGWRDGWVTGERGRWVDG